MSTFPQSVLPLCRAYSRYAPAAFRRFYINIISTQFQGFLLICLMQCLPKSLIYMDFIHMQPCLESNYELYIINFHVTRYSAKKERILLDKQDSAQVYSVKEKRLAIAYCPYWALRIRISIWSGPAVYVSLLATAVSSILLL